MPCYICDGPIEELQLDPRDNKTKPCSVCQEVVWDTFKGMFKSEEEADNALFGDA